PHALSESVLSCSEQIGTLHATFYPLHAAVELLCTSRFASSPSAISAVRSCRSAPHFFSVILRVYRFSGRLSIAGHNGSPRLGRCSSSFLSQIRSPAQEGRPWKCPPLIFIATENGISAHFSHSCSFSFLSRTASANP